MPNISELPKNSTLYPNGSEYDNPLSGTEMIVLETSDGKTGRDLLSRLKDWILSIAETMFASITHNHDDAYAAVNHDHDDAYAGVNHTHPQAIEVVDALPVEVQANKLVWSKSRKELFIGNESNIPVLASGVEEIVLHATQSGTNAPDIIVLKNPLNRTITPSYVSAGTYDLTIPGSPFAVSEKVDVSCDQFDNELGLDEGGLDVKRYARVNTAETIRLVTSLVTGPEDDRMINFKVRIKIYP